MDTVSDTDRVAAAEAYIDALVSHNADSVPFAPDCTRIEQGMKTGFSGNHLRRSLNRGPQYRIIAAATDRNFTVIGDEVRHVHHRDQGGVRRSPRGGRIDETFLIPAGDAKIRYIRARFHPRIERSP